MSISVCQVNTKNIEKVNKYVENKENK